MEIMLEVYFFLYWRWIGEQVGTMGILCNSVTQSGLNHSQNILK